MRLPVQDVRWLGSAEYPEIQQRIRGQRRHAPVSSSRLHASAAQHEHARDRVGPIGRENRADAVRVDALPSGVRDRSGARWTQDRWRIEAEHAEISARGLLEKIAVDLHRERCTWRYCHVAPE